MPLNFFIIKKKKDVLGEGIIFRHVELTADGRVVNTSSPQITWQGLVGSRFVCTCVRAHTHLNDFKCLGKVP